MFHKHLAVAAASPRSPNSHATFAPDLANDTFLNALLKIPEQRQSNPTEWLVSLLLHVVVIAGIIAAPLCFMPSLDLHNLQLTYLVTPLPPPAPAPAAPALPRSRPIARSLHAVQLTMPVAIPKQIVMGKEEPIVQPEIDGVPGGVPGGSAEGVLGGLLSGATQMPSFPEAAPKPGAHSPAPSIVRVGGDVKPPHRTVYVEPKYPFLAKQAHVQGEVIVEAIIDERGNVVQAHGIDGPSLLIPAALQAVMQWKYEPTRLNGEPVALSLRVSVNFGFGIAAN